MLNHLLRLLCLSLAFTAAPATAAVLYSGVQNIPIPTTFSGVTLTLNRADATDISGVDPSGSTAGSAWDLNFFLGGAGLVNGPNAQPVRESTSNISFVHNLTPGTEVNGGSTVSTAFGGSGFPNQHIGAGPNQFTNAVSGYFGIVLDPGASPLYGWVKVTLDNSGTPGIIESWAFETTPNTPLQVGVIPEPGTPLLLLAAAGSALFRRRRGRQAP